MSKKRLLEKTDKSIPGNEASKNIGQTPNEELPAQTFDEYECSGNAEIDFPGLCAFLDMKYIPSVNTKKPAPSPPESEAEDSSGDNKNTDAAPYWSKRCLQVELENEDPLSGKKLKVFGWKVDEQIVRVLQKMLPSMSNLRSIQFWQAGLTDPMVMSLLTAVPLCSNLRTVTLEGNPLPEQSYHLLLSEDSTLAHLSLRNNRIGDEGARLIGSALSTTTSSNRKLLSINLAFNSIGDAGATSIAQGLRLNCTLLYLSLSSNRIGDTGAAHLAAVLGEFALTHDEVLERKRLLLESIQSLPADQHSSLRSTSLSSYKEEKSQKGVLTEDNNPHATKTKKSHKKSSDKKEPHSRGNTEQELKAQEDDTPTQAEVEQNPLLDPRVVSRNDELVLPGNKCLVSLSLAGNRITERSLPLFLKSLEMQSEGQGLLRLCLQGNRFSPECESYVKLMELMALRGPLEKK